MAQKADPGEIRIGTALRHDDWNYRAVLRCKGVDGRWRVFARCEHRHGPRDEARDCARDMLGDQSRVHAGQGLVRGGTALVMTPA